MTILHYALGFPPYRTGGLTKFCMDLMVQQARDGHRVALLWPGRMGFVSHAVSLRRRTVTVEGCTVESLEVVNPLPVSYDEGIRDFAAFTADGGRAAYDRLLDFLRPEVLHVHTLMGLHAALLDAAKARGIRLVFTAHDFFPLCPKVTLFHHGALCTGAAACADCGVCNATALSLNKIRILQSPLYRLAKDSPPVRALRRHHRDAYLGETAEPAADAAVGTPADFAALRSYYGGLLGRMDLIHYNSTVTRRVYTSLFSLPQGCCLPVTHSDIRDHRRIKTFSSSCLRIRYLGPCSGAKGYFLLRDALDLLWQKRQDFRLDVPFTPAESRPYLHPHGRYRYDDLEAIFAETDLLVAPSVWYETFGFTVPEALSYGVPVLLSATVGAQDILVPGAGRIVPANTPEAWCDALAALSARDLAEMNRVIVARQPVLQLPELSDRLLHQCYRQEESRS